MQRKQQVGECWVCVIYSLQGFGGNAPEFFFLGFHVHFWVVLGFHVHLWWFFGTWFFADGFLFSVKELGLLTNPGHWIRFLDAVGSYMYIVL
jgi:hypothetical protein